MFVFVMWDSLTTVDFEGADNLGGNDQHPVARCPEGHHQDSGGGSGRLPQVSHVKGRKGQSDPRTERARSQGQRGHLEGHELCPK